MVQTISLETITKDISPKKLVDNQESGVDFLELLMKDLDTKEIVLDDNSFKNKKEKLESFMEDDKKGDIKFDTQKVDGLKFDLVQLKQEPTPQNKNITEIKNIITSKLKQENVLVSKQELKEFKKIDNIKDLIKFADKKGLNIKELKVEIETTTNKKLDIKNLDIQDKPTIFTKQLLDKKDNQTKNVDVSPQKTTKDKVNLENILKTSKHTKNQSQKTINNEISIDKNSKHKSSNLSPIKTDKNENVLNDTKTSKNKTPQQELKVNKDTKHTTKKQDISLETIIQPKPKEIKKDNLNSNSNNINVNSQPQPQIQTELKTKIVNAKQTIDSFKNNLDEAIKNYKPPISKVNIELNPKNLGKVEVSIIQRGNNIQVNMNSDQNNIQLFQTHQAEFRQALSNIGFSNIDMNFNSNQDRDKKQQGKKIYKENDMEVDNIENPDIEITANYRYA